jgi:Protein-glutamine gamma-glutamyltransferase
LFAIGQAGNLPPTPSIICGTGENYMRGSRISRCVVLVAVLILLAVEHANGREKKSSGLEVRSAKLARLLDSARNELQTAGIAEKEIELRLKVVENTATVKAYYPHADGGRPESRNPKYWRQNDEGSYVPRENPVESIKDLWQTTSGIRCRKLSALVMIKAIIDVSDAKQLAQLNALMRDKVIPNELPNDGVGQLFQQLRPKHGKVFQNDEFLSGDEVWFENPYFSQLSRKQQSQYRGQEGHHVFYVGGGQVMDMYSREPTKIENFRHTFLDWGSVQTVAKNEKRRAKADEFQIKQVRRAIREPVREGRVAGGT